MPIGATLAAISLGASVLGGVARRRRRRSAAQAQARELGRQAKALNNRKRFEVGRMREQGEQFLGKLQTRAAVSGLAGGAGTSTALGYEKSARNIDADIDQLSSNFDMQISQLSSQRDAAKKASRFSFGDAMGFIGDVAGAGYGYTDAGGGFSGLKNMIRRPRPATGPNYGIH